MKIIRPYGFSRTERQDGAFERRLELRAAERPSRDIPEFAANEIPLVIGQWISLIDKIARKPAGNSKPTRDQRTFRDRLGQACWSLLSTRLPSTGAEEKENVARLWRSRVHPYREGERAAEFDKSGRLKAWARVKGRFYKAFAGDRAPGDADADDIARQIAAKLHGEGGRKGLIAARAESIKHNVFLRPKKPEAAWTPEDVAGYLAPGDPVARIRADAEAIENAGRRMSHGAAAATLHEHWEKAFRGGDDAILTVTQARSACEGRLAVHDRVRLCYRSLLKRARRDTRAQREDADAKEKVSVRLSLLLPRDLDEALGLRGQQQSNADLAELVQLGKIIHYSAPRKGGDGDHPAHAVDNWPQGWRDPGAPKGGWLRAIEASDCWTSDGQAEIKRSEAFVRMWRQALVLARWTLTDWASMKEIFVEDILGGDKQREKAVEAERFVHGKFYEKLRLLFGRRAERFEFSDNEQRRQFLGGLIRGAAELRHASFHFKGRKDLLDALGRLPEHMENGGPGERNDVAKTTAAKLWDEDARGRFAQLRETLIGVRAQEFLTQDQADEILQLIARATAAELPLPRFSRILTRRENVCPEGNIPLPPPAKRDELEADPARRCQYTIIKLVYERPFRAWLDERSAGELQGWIDRAVRRANLEAQNLQGAGRSEDAKALIAARASRLKGLAADADARSAMVGFVRDLSRESASEMRIQRGYESNAEKARKQAEYIEDLLCDVTLLAFDRYLKEAKLDWLRSAPEPRATACDLPVIEPTEAEVTGEDWQKALYLILHLIPVESVGQLKHQLMRWDIAARARREGIPEEERGRLDALFAAMTHYLDMHDAKFTGDMALAGCEDFKRLFESGDEGFQKVFPSAQALDEKTERRLPRRGLREIARFGHLPLVETLCGGAKIGDETIDRVMAMEDAPAGEASEIAKWHRVREELHEKLAPLKKSEIKRHDVLRYADVVATLAAHREASNFVNLVDHVRVHRIVMAVWSRMVDYAGLFERDLYFVTLALLHRSGMAPADLLTEDGVDLLKTGQTITALAPDTPKKKTRQNTEQADELFAAIKRLFRDVWEESAALKHVRNRLAHLDLRGWKNSKAAPAPQLTDRINDARRLMAYDRKMKNAVTKSVIELMQREGVDIFWSIPEGDAGHGLTGATLSPRTIQHLDKNGVRLSVRDHDPKKKGEPLKERLVSDACVKMLAAAFGGHTSQTESVIEIIDKIDLGRDPLMLAGAPPRGKVGAVVQ